MSLTPFDIDARSGETSSEFVGRVDTARHRGMKNALQALRPGLLVCDPVSFKVLFANETAREILGFHDTKLPAALPDGLTITRMEESGLAQRKGVAFFKGEIDGEPQDVRVVPVYGVDGEVQTLLVTIRDYEGISWSLFEMLDRLPIAVVALSPEGNDVRYINRTAVREMSAGRAGVKARRGGRGQDLLSETIALWLKHMPADGEGSVELPAGRMAIDLHFSRLMSEEGEPAKLIYWDSRVLEIVKQ